MNARTQHRRLTSNWKQEIFDLWGIRLLGEIECNPETLLWTTRCCRTKRGEALGQPRDFYVSPIVQFFCRLVEQAKLRYGVLSDRYGLHLDFEELEWYDIHPGSLCMEDKERIGRLIRQKALLMGFDSIVFYSNAPLMSVPYFEMLYYSRLNIWYTTKLDLLAEYYTEKKIDTSKVTICTKTESS